MPKTYTSRHKWMVTARALMVRMRARRVATFATGPDHRRTYHLNWSPA